MITVERHNDWLIQKYEHSNSAGISNRSSFKFSKRSRKTATNACDDVFRSCSSSDSFTVHSRLLSGSGIIPSGRIRNPSSNQLFPDWIFEPVICPTNRRYPAPHGRIGPEICHACYWNNNWCVSQSMPSDKFLRKAYDT